MSDQNPEPMKPLNLRRFARPKTLKNVPRNKKLNQEPLISPRQTRSKTSTLTLRQKKRARDQNLQELQQEEQISEQNVRLPNGVQSEQRDDLNELYTKIRSIPNYSAKITEFLRQNAVHSKHRRIVKKKFPRRRIVVHCPFQIFMADLIEYQNNEYKYANSGNKFILVVIDIFTKKAYARPVKNKNKFNMAIAMESILDSLDHYPNTLITDEGLEFYNRSVQEVLDKYAIHHYSIKSKMKASVVERFIRTLKSRLEKYFVSNKTKRWIDVLPQLIKNYNNTPHRSIGMSPNKVTDENADKVFKTMFPDIHLDTKPRLQVGNIVRKLKEKTIFEKGYKQTWSDELYKIIRVKQSAGRVWYIIADMNGIRQSGIKYYWELNLVKK